MHSHRMTNNADRCLWIIKLLASVRVLHLGAGFEFQCHKVPQSGPGQRELIFRVSLLGCIETNKPNVSIIIK